MEQLEQKFEKIVAGLRIDDRTQAEHKDDLRWKMLSEFNRVGSQEDGVRERFVESAGKVLRSRTVKFAIAAMIIIAVMIGMAVYFGREAGKDKPVVKDNDPGVNTIQEQVVPDKGVEDSTELNKIQIAEKIKLAGELYKAGNAEGLIAMLDDGNEQVRISAANYLAGLGDVSAMGALRKLSSQWEGQAKDNPYTAAIEEIESSIKDQEQQVKDGGENESGDETSEDTVGVEDAEKTMLVRVIEKDTQKPIAGADIGTYTDGGSNSYNADQEGEYLLCFGADEPMLMNLFASREGYVGKSIRLIRRRDEQLPTEILFELDKGTVIGGVVQDGEGNLIEGATVYFSINDESVPNEIKTDERYEGSTDKEGRWECNTVPADVLEIYVRVKHPDFAEYGFMVPREIPIEKLRDKTAVLVIDKGISCFGYVSDLDGNPIADAKLLFGQSRYTNDPEDRTETDDEGYFEFVKMKPLNRSFILTVQADGFGPAMREVFLNELDKAVEFILEPGQRIAGRVVDGAGKPVAGAKVYAEEWRGCQSVEWQVTTGEDGRFVWEDAPADEIEIDVYKSGYMRISDTMLIASDSEYELILLPPIRVSGAVVDAETSEPVKEFKVIPGIKWFVEPGVFQNIAWQGGAGWTSVQNEGRYEYSFTMHGEYYQIRIEAEGYMPLESRKITNDEQDVIIDFEMVRSDGPSGFVVSADGRPVAGADVYLRADFFDMDNNNVNQKRYHQEKGFLVRTDDKGRFQFNPQVREYPLVVVAKEGFTEVSTETFAADNTIVLQRYGRVEGDYYVGTKPAVDSSIRLDYPDRMQRDLRLDISYITKTNSDGKFVFEKVVPGLVRVKRKKFEVAPGETVEIHLGGAGRTVRGRFISPEGVASLEKAGHTNISIDLIEPEVPESEFPKPDDFDSMSYTEVMQWLTEFAQSEEGLAWRKEAEEKYRIDSRYYHVYVEDNGMFSVDNVEPGRYLIRGKVWARKPNVRIDYKTVVARMAQEFVVPEIEYEEQMDEVLDIGDIYCLAGKLKVGDMAPDFEVPNLMGPGTIGLSDYAGKFLLLNFYNTYILNERSEQLEGIKQLDAEFGSRDDFAIVGIYLDHTSMSFLVEKMFQEFKLSGPHGIATHYNSKIEIDYSVENLPYSVLIGPDGEVICRDLKGDELIRAVRGALQD